jgi:serine/threonine protein phosphatase 1
MYILTDPHGHYKTFKALLAKLPDKGRMVAVAGDLIDRGPDSARLVEFVKQECEAGRMACVRGNHEDMMMEEGLSPNMSGIWIANGGLQCLESYKTDVKVPDYDLPASRVDLNMLRSHIRWMQELPLMLKFPELKNKDGRYLVVSHSSVSHVWGKSELSQYDIEQSIIWGRRKPVDVPGIYNIFGHTPQKDGPKIERFYANIDTGCFHKEPGYGRLTAISFPEMQVFQQKNID